MHKIIGALLLVLIIGTASGATGREAAMRTDTLRSLLSFFHGKDLALQGEQEADSKIIHTILTFIRSRETTFYAIAMHYFDLLTLECIREPERERITREHDVYYGSERMRKIITALDEGFMYKLIRCLRQEDYEGAYELFLANHIKREDILCV